MKTFEDKFRKINRDILPAFWKSVPVWSYRAIDPSEDTESMKTFEDFRETEAVTEQSIRARILKAWKPLRIFEKPKQLQSNRSERGYWKRESTHTHDPGWLRVTEQSIRARILKVKIAEFVPVVQVGYRAIDPSEDTESQNSRILFPWSSRLQSNRSERGYWKLLPLLPGSLESCRAIDPSEDTERAE